MKPNLVQLVRVTTDCSEPQLWAAATRREEAVACVLNVIPQGWNARLLNGSLKLRQDIIRTMTPSEVRQLSG